MAKELKIDNEEVFETIEKGSNIIQIKILQSSGKDVIDARVYYYEKGDVNGTKPLPTGKGLWMDRETALLVGMALVDAVEKLNKK